MKVGWKLLLAALPLVALPGLGQEATRAGEIRAMRPAATLERAGAEPTAAKVDDAIHWQDWFATAEEGRARLSLDNGSVVNVGSAARVQITPGEEATSASSIVLAAGKVRAFVAKQGPRPESFSVRTSTAVIGVIGTHVFVHAEENQTTVINIEGRSQVKSADPGIAGEAALGVFEAVTVEQGKAPGPKRKVSWEEVLRAMLDTLPGEAFALSPSSGRAGRCLTVSSPQALPETTALGGTQAPQCKLPDADSARLCLPEDAEVGVREFSIAGAGGAKLWSAFMVLPKPGEAHAVDGAHFLVPSVALPGSTVTAYLMSGTEPIPNTAIDIFRNGRVSNARTSSSGSVAVRVPETGVLEFVAYPSSLRTPVPLPDVRARIEIDPKMKVKDLKLPAMLQPGVSVTVAEEFKSVALDGQELPTATIISPQGEMLTTFIVPPESAGATGKLKVETVAGKARTVTVAFYEILGASLDHSKLISGEVASGGYVICVRDPSVKKLKARIQAVGPVRFRGKGAKGKRVEVKLAPKAGEALTIPFQLQAEKTGTAAAIPFALTLKLERD